MIGFASDGGRDAIAEFIAWTFDSIPFAMLGVVAVLASVVGLIHLVRSAFPKKVHRWCGGKGHWGIGPFRRSCPGCSGSGLVDR